MRFSTWRSKYAFVVELYRKSYKTLKTLQLMSKQLWLFEDSWEICTFWFKYKTYKCFCSTFTSIKNDIFTVCYVRTQKKKWNDFFHGLSSQGDLRFMRFGMKTISWFIVPCFASLHIQNKSLSPKICLLTTQPNSNFNNVFKLDDRQAVPVAGFVAHQICLL